MFKNLLRGRNKAEQPKGAKSFQMTGSNWPFFWNRNRIVGRDGHAVIPENNSAVVAALRWAMGNCVSAPPVVERFINTRYELIPNHPAQLLWNSPNPWMTGRQLTQGVFLSLVLDGNAYVFKARSVTGKLNGLQYLPHGHVTAIPGFDDNGSPVPIAFYEYRAGSKTLQIAPGDMIHIKDGIDPYNSALGWSGLRTIVDEILTDDEASVYTHAVLKNLGVSGFMISPVGDGVITEDQAERLKHLIKSETTGDQRGDPIVLSQAVQIDTKGYSPEQMALDKMRKFPEARILSVIGLNGLILGLNSGEDTKTFSNYGEARSSAYEDWLMPRWTLIDETLTNQLLPEFGISQIERFSRDISGVKVFMEDLNSLTDRTVNQYLNGICLRSEARQALGYPTTDDDDVYYLDAQASLITDGQAKNYLKADIVRKLTQRNLTDRGY